MKYALLGIAVLVLVVIGAGFLPADPGFVVLSYGSKLVRLSFVLFAGLLLLFILSVYVLIRVAARLASWRRRVLLWRRQRRRLRSREALERGFRALAHGDWPLAEKLFQQGTQADASEPLHYLGAAEAAHAQRERTRRDGYLTAARDAVPAAELAIGLQQATIAIEETDHAQARAILDRLRNLEPKNSEVLRLLRVVCVATGSWADLINDVLPTSRRVRDGAELDPIERQAHAALLTQATELDAVEQIWRHVPRALRAEPEVLGAYAAALNRAGAGGKAEALLRKVLERGAERHLIEVYCALQGADRVRQQRLLEDLLRASPEDPVLLFALGRLDLAQSLWGSARDRLQRLIAREPGAEAYRLLAEAHEGLKQPAEAAACYRKGLLLATAGRFNQLEKSLLQSGERG